MKFINKISIQLFALIIICDTFGTPSSCSSLPLFDSAEVNINAPRPIVELLPNIPGLSSIFKTNKRFDSSPQEIFLHHSINPVSLNVNAQQQQQQQPFQQYTAENYQYMPPPTNLQEGYYYPQSYYYPSHSQYYGHGYYPTATSPFPQPSYSYWHHEQYSEQPPFPQPNNRPVNPSADQNPYFSTHETTKMSPLAPIADTKQPISRTPSPYREKPKGVITPDSPFYVPIPEEPTIYGIEPRR